MIGGYFRRVAEKAVAWMLWMFRPPAAEDAVSTAASIVGEVQERRAACERSAAMEQLRLAAKRLAAQRRRNGVDRRFDIYESMGKHFQNRT